jgi:hypothetical protein
MNHTTQSIITVIVIIAATVAVIPAFVASAYADFGTSNTATQTANPTSTATGDGVDADFSSGICQQIAQSGAFGNSINKIGDFVDC